MIVEYDSFDREQEDGQKGKNYQALPESGGPRKQRHNLREKGLQVRGVRSVCQYSRPEHRRMCYPTPAPLGLGTKQRVKGQI